MTQSDAVSFCVRRGDETGLRIDRSGRVRPGMLSERTEIGIDPLK
jgi:hypothetical protein